MATRPDTVVASRQSTLGAGTGPGRVASAQGVLALALAAIEVGGSRLRTASQSSDWQNSDQLMLHDSFLPGITRFPSLRHELLTLLRGS